jgi:hypothetical protein
MPRFSRRSRGKDRLTSSDIFGHTRWSAHFESTSLDRGSLSRTLADLSGGIRTGRIAASES